MCEPAGPSMPSAPLRRGGAAVLVAIPVFLIRIYQRLISPFLPRLCRFSPSCSQYAVEALKARGLWVGSLLAAYRVLRCNPFCRSGFDPVPSAGLRTFGEPRNASQ